MRSFRRSIGVLAITFAVMALLAVPHASAAKKAQKKLTYEQAWAKCKQELDAAGVYGVGLDAGARSTAGGACMKKYGYRL